MVGVGEVALVVVGGIGGGGGGAAAGVASPTTYCRSWLVREHICKDKNIRISDGSPGLP